MCRFDMIDPLRIYGIDTSRRNVGRPHLHHVGPRRRGAQHGRNAKNSEGAMTYYE